MMNNQYEKLLNRYYNLEHRYLKLKQEADYYKDQRNIYRDVIKNTKIWLTEQANKFHNICGENWSTVGEAIYQEVLNKINKFYKAKGSEKNERAD